MAPEAFNRKRNVQTDIWSSGVVLYEMLTGRMPFQGGDVAEFYATVLNEEPQPMPDFIPLSLQSVVMKALAKSPAERYAAAREMREDLLFCLSAAGDKNLPAHSLKTKSENALVKSTAESLIPDSRTSENFRFQKTGDYSEAVDSDKSALPKRPRKFFTLKYLAAAILLLIFSAAAGGFFFFFNPQPIPFRKGDKFGYSTWRKNLVIGAKYDLALPFAQVEKLGLVALGQKDVNGNFTGKYGFIDRRGREIVPLEYDAAESFADGLANVGKYNAAAQSTRFGFIDDQGREVIPPGFEDALNFSEKLAAVKFQGKWGFIDKNGRQVVPFKYDSAAEFSGGLAAVGLAGRYGFIDLAGNEQIALEYDFAGKFAGGVAPVRKDGKVFFINSEGAAALPFKYDNAANFSEGLAMVTLNGKSGFIEKSGSEIIAFRYDNETSVFSEGLAAVRLNGKSGFIDSVGNPMIPFKYTNAEPLRNNLALVKTTYGKEYYNRFDGTEF
jgi:hypothetical protein